MQQEYKNIVFSEISRKKFLRYVLGVIVFVSLPVNWLCRPQSDTKAKNQKFPALKGLSEEEYLNVNAMAEVFISDSPVPDFDAALAMDHYIHDRIEPVAIREKLKELFAVPSSILIAILFDFSLTIMRDLPVKERAVRLHSWKNSSFSLKRTVYHAFRQGTLLMLTSSRRYQDYTGYIEDFYFRPFEKKINI
ncbi:MAG: hypothetical protein OEV66_00745 [Spirochaetia bacterium]|nr:hypothetical protein [Spirochaetia bacterium]